jgi:NAD(P)-dependent dehydrogenase (short-subunit alcohol dehydrogenase family)
VDDRVVFITGAARGVGRATALAFARSGAALAVTDGCLGDGSTLYPMASETDLQAVEDECRSAGAAAVSGAVLDVRSSAAVEAAVDDCAQRFGGLDVLVNCAGVIGPAKRGDDLTDEEWGLVLDVDLSGPWRCARAAARHMSRGGAIVNVASTAGLVAFPHFASYVAAKHGVVGLTRALALDLADIGIRVNAVCPTSIEPDDGSPSMLGGVASMLGLSLADYGALSLPNHPLRALPRNDDVAAAIVWLASESASTVTGAAITVDSGFTAR